LASKVLGQDSATKIVKNSAKEFSIIQETKD